MYMFTCFIFLTEYCEAHTGLEFLMPLSPSQKCWASKCAPLQLA